MMLARVRTYVFPLAVSLLAPAVMPAALAAQEATDAAARLDSVFARWDSPESPGCAVAIGREGRTIMERAYGMADLEHGLPNTTETIFEAGSVSKQFTAAAIVLLALDGKLSLDDDVRTYVPELPDYGTPITIRHLMTHTSGLRDWGSVAAISGWGRSERTHSHAHVLDILSRQSALNFAPGEQYSYSNSGYNLMAVIVDRVSGMPFAEFSKRRIFEPLGLESTQWRDDYRRIVKGRSSAYSTRGDEFVIDRPIEHVHGNGGLLTTVGDLLTWTEELQTGRHFGPEFVALMHERGRLNNGERIGYASGLMVGERNGEPLVSHTGATSGYRAYLGRFPERHLALSILCNVSNANPGALGGQVADIFLPPETRLLAQPETPRAPAEDSEGERPAPTARELAAYEGEYYSEDAETTFHVVAEDGRLYLLRRPGDRFALSPTAADEFRGRAGQIRFIRDATGRVVEFSISQSRVFDMRFRRVDG